MLIVIDIPDRYTKLIGFTTPELEVIAKAVIHGTPLPDDAEILTAEAYSELCLMASELNDIKSEIKALEQQPKVGEWLEKEVIDNSYKVIEEWQSARCSVCDKYHTTPYMYYFDNYKFCPNCGARMEAQE